MYNINYLGIFATHRELYWGRLDDLQFLDF